MFHQPANKTPQLPTTPFRSAKIAVSSPLADIKTSTPKETDHHSQTPSDNIFLQGLKHDFLHELETRTSQGCGIRHFGRRRLSTGHGPAIAADELDSGTGPSEHDGSAWNQSASSRSQRE